MVMATMLQETKVSNAVSLILSHSKAKKNDDVLGGECQPVQLQIGVKKIPKATKRLKLKLPQPIRNPGDDICLFVKDLDKSDRDTDSTVAHYEELFSKKGVKNIKEIIPVKSLKTDYKPYEAKWNLSNAYDFYLADERVVACLPRLLGKSFYGRKKVPVQINILAKDLNGEIDRAINTSIFSLTDKGSSSMAVVGHSGMSQEDITANVMAAVDQISAAVPGSSDNIKQLSIKVRSSTGVPIYLSQGGPQDITIRRPKTKKSPVEIDELSTLPDSDTKVAVFPDGKVIILRDGETLKTAIANERKARIGERKRPAPKQSKSPMRKARKLSKEPAQKGGEISEESPKKAKKMTPKKAVKIMKKMPKKAGKISKETPKKAGKVSKETPKKAGKVSKETPKKAGKISTETPKKAGKILTETPKKAGKISKKSPKKAGKKSKEPPKKARKLMKEKPGKKIK